MTSALEPPSHDASCRCICRVDLPLITRGMIVEADHNMFSDPEIDTEGDSGAYDPAHGAEWFNFLRQKGLLDVEREEMGRGARLDLLGARFIKVTWYASRDWTSLWSRKDDRSKKDGNGPSQSAQQTRYRSRATTRCYGRNWSCLTRKTAGSRDLKLT